MTLLGYARVSTADQALRGQLEVLINIRPKRFKKRPNWKEQPERPSLTGKQWQ
jgi:hypothetical protein